MIHLRKYTYFISTGYVILIHYQIICHDEHNVWPMVLFREIQTAALLPTLSDE
jgi:hypothetical protein